MRAYGVNPKCVHKFSFPLHSFFFSLFFPHAHHVVDLSLSVVLNLLKCFLSLSSLNIHTLSVLQFSGTKYTVLASIIKRFMSRFTDSRQTTGKNFVGMQQAVGCYRKSGILLVGSSYKKCRKVNIKTFTPFRAIICCFVYECKHSLKLFSFSRQSCLKKGQVV